ncbi:MAG: glycosyltransferase, partial [Planctomycetota bacterium]
MHIACVIHSLDGGGAERVMAGLVSRLASRGHRITLVTLGDGASRHRVADSVRVINLNVMSRAHERVPVWRRLRKLSRTLRELDPDVALSFCDQINLLVLIATRPACSFPIVVSERSDPRVQKMGWFKEWLRRQLYRYASRVVALTDEVATYLAETTGAQTTVIPTAVELPDSFCKRTESADDPSNGEPQPLLLVAAGRLEREKGFDRLIDALAELPSSVDWTLELLGEGSQRSALQQQVIDHGLSDRVRMPGWHPIWDVLERADVFVLPSRYEGFPSAMLEAMASGTAVVAVDIGGGVRKAIEHGVNGWLTKNTIAGITSGLQTLAGDPALRRRLAK